MRTFRLILATLAAGALVASCEPLEDTSWTKNSRVYLDWKYANPETGMRPVELDSLSTYYFSQSDKVPNLIFPMPTNEGRYDVVTDCYDIVVTHPSPFYKRTERFRSMEISFPTRINHKAERVIATNPEEMIYSGVMPGVHVNWDVRRSVYVTMQRMLKELNFVVTITDTDELLYPCTVDMSGMASNMKVWSGEYDPETEAVQIFKLYKHGRFLNSDKCLTAYTGKVMCLGTIGRNILYFTYYDAAGRERMGKYDLTPYLGNWNTDEVTVRINIDASDDSVYMDGWEEGDTTDFIFDFDELTKEEEEW